MSSGFWFIYFVHYDSFNIIIKSYIFSGSESESKETEAEIDPGAISGGTVELDDSVVELTEGAFSTEQPEQPQDNSEEGDISNEDPGEPTEASENVDGEHGVEAGVAPSDSDSNEGVLNASTEEQVNPEVVDDNQETIENLEDGGSNIQIAVEQQAQEYVNQEYEIPSHDHGVQEDVVLATYT